MRQSHCSVWNGEKMSCQQFHLLIYSEHLCVFCITVIQVFKIEVCGKGFGSKPKLIMCPQISHNLEITFNSRKDFNKEFAKLDSLHTEAKINTFTTNNKPNVSANKKSLRGQNPRHYFNNLLMNGNVPVKRNKANLSKNSVRKHDFFGKIRV
ncbi:unnamed protein product [Rhizophagus irregularis]|uniref:Uncharacterized protein n=4 Tax=Rhizophagus irregularis TaxID=588596 RepID=A0A915ZPU6_9GLOM|nr:unnamed protein product [Rhizophagus irregularis]